MGPQSVWVSGGEALLTVSIEAGARVDYQLCGRRKIRRCILPLEVRVSRRVWRTGCASPMLVTQPDRPLPRSEVATAIDVERGEEGAGKPPLTLAPTDVGDVYTLRRTGGEFLLLGVASRMQ